MTLDFAVVVWCRLRHLLGLQLAPQKLEPPTANPTLRTMARLKKVLPELELDELLSA